MTLSLKEAPCAAGRTLKSIILAAAVCICSVTACPGLAQDAGGWISKKGTSFVRNGKTFKFIGANAVNLVFYDDWGLDLDKAVATAKKNNISVLRLYMNWGWAKDEDFDAIISKASESGIYLILVLTDCCCSSDYEDLSGYFKVHAPFCNVTEEKSRAAFKNRIKQIIERRNILSGRLYREEPAILAWEIANELEYGHFSGPQVRSWVEDISGFIRRLDRNHLITISIVTDGADFDSGNKLYRMFDIDNIDFFSFHFYPGVLVSGSTERIDRGYVKKIKTRVKNFIAMGKPVVMGEFGFSNRADINSKFRSGEKSALYTGVFRESFDAAFASGASGVLFWGWGVREEKDIPMWWAGESHNEGDREFSAFIRDYRMR